MRDYMKFSRERNKYILDRRLKGEQMYKIAESLGLSRPRIRQILIKQIKLIFNNVEKFPNIFTIQGNKVLFIDGKGPKINFWELYGEEQMKELKK